MFKLSLSLGLVVFSFAFLSMYVMTDSAFNLSESLLSDPNCKIILVIFHIGLSAIAGLICGIFAGEKTSEYF